MKKKTKWTIISLVIIIFLLIFFYVIGGYTSNAYVRCNWTEISPRVAGYVDNVYVTNNQFVNKGDILFELDRYPYLLKLQQIQASLDAAMAAQLKLQDTLKSLEGKFKVATQQLQILEINVNRYKKLSDEKALSIEQYQDMLTSYDQTKETTYQDLQENIDTTKDQLTEQKATIALLTAQRDYAKFEYDVTQVLAPFSGYVTNMYLMRGKELNKGESVFGIAQAQSPWIEANYKEYWVGRIKAGQTVWIMPDLYPAHILKGRVVSVGMAVNRSDTPGLVLPYIEPSIDWVRLQYRFTVIIAIDNPPKDKPLRMGSDARTFVWF